jgi:hypothetical protein
LTPKTQAAHRLAWGLLVGPIPEGAMLCHRCPGGSNAACVNPAHLYIGDQDTNMADRDREGRTARGDRARHLATRRRGERHHMTLVTEAEVLEMRARYDRGELIAWIARDYGVPDETAGRIVKRQTWRHI